MDSAQLDQQSCPGLNFSCPSAAIMPRIYIYGLKIIYAFSEKNDLHFTLFFDLSVQAFHLSFMFSAAWDMKVWNQHVPGLTQLQVTIRQRRGPLPRRAGWSSGRTKPTGAELLIHWQWRKWGCRRSLPPGPPHASCASPPEVLVVDSGEDSWCSLPQVSGPPYLGEWAPSAHLGWLPIQQIRDKEQSHTLPYRRSFRNFKVMSQLTRQISWLSTDGCFLLTVTTFKLLSFRSQKPIHLKNNDLTTR